MTRRITKADLQHQLNFLRSAMRDAGIQITLREHGDDRYGPAHDVVLDADTVQIQTGSPTYGRAYRIFYVHPETGGHYSMDWNDYLGTTAREAYGTLMALRQGILAATRAQAERVAGGK